MFDDMPPHLLPGAGRSPTHAAAAATAMLALAAAVSTPHLAAAQESPDETAIRATRSASNEAIARHDLDAFLASIDDPYQGTAGSGWFAADREALRQVIGDQFSRFDDLRYERTPSAIHVSASDPLAWEEGEWLGTWTLSEGEHRSGGRYAAQWRKVDGTWKIHSELFVTMFCEGAGCD